MDKETFAKNLKNKMSNEFSKLDLQGTDFIKDVNSYLGSVEESKNVETPIIRKPFKKGIKDKLVGNKKMKKPIGKITTMMPIMGEKKSETKEATGASASGQYSMPLFSTTKKKSIEENQKLKGGLSDKLNLKDIASKNGDGTLLSKLIDQLNIGIKVEMEHTKDRDIAKEIAMDHLSEDPEYYTKLKKVEAKESTGSSSSGSYETPKAWAKSMTKKDWRGASKTQIPGGKFVSVKKKCKKFPYCNQGDIKALKLSEGEMIDNAIKKISDSYQIDESVIKNLLIRELKLNQRVP